jgi:hypothetical protein
MSHPFKLIRTNGTMIPGGYQFHDSITGKSYQDRHTLFAGRVMEIIRDRQANKRLWTDPKVVDPEYVSSLLSEQNCARLKNNKLLCSNGLSPVNEPVSIPVAIPAGRTCRWCRSDQLEAVLCPTCSGSRITHFRCKACGKDTPR